jgi:hypothetical protein
MLLALAAGAAWTQERSGALVRQGNAWVEEVHGVLTGATRLRVVSPDGGIEVRGGSQPEISYRVRKRARLSREEDARRAIAECPLKVRQVGETAELILDCPARRWGQRVGADFYVTVPKTLARAALETMGGGLFAENFDGELSARTAGGGIQVDRIGGAVVLETAGGAIKLGHLLGRVRAQTAGGPIELLSAADEAILTTNGGNISVGQCVKTLRAETAGGEIRIQRAGGDVTAGTAGGDVRIGEALGKVVAQTSGGSIHVDSARGLVRAETAGGGIRLWKIAGPVRAESAAGNITAQVVADRRLWGESNLATTVGDVVVYLPSDLAVTIRATIEAAGSRHRIVSDFPLNIRPSDLAGVRELFGEGDVNGGGAPLRIRTTSGNIEIRKVK